jgi:hypothetical protein
MGNLLSNNNISIPNDEYKKYLRYKHQLASRRKKNIPRKTLVNKINSKKIKNIRLQDPYTHEYHYTNTDNRDRMNEYIYFNNNIHTQNINNTLPKINTDDNQYNGNLNDLLELKRRERNEIIKPTKKKEVIHNSKVSNINKKQDLSQYSIDPLGLLKDKKYDINELIDRYKILRKLYANGNKEVYTNINYALLKLIKIKQNSIKKF